MSNRLLSLFALAFLCLHGAFAQVSFQKIIGGTKNDVPNKVIIIPDGYLIAGTTRSNFDFGQAAFLLKTDQQGNIIWQKNYQGIGGNVFKDVIPANGGGYLAVGSNGATSSTDAGSLFIVRVDADGNVLWSRNANSADGESVDAVLRIADGYILTGARNIVNFGALNAFAIRIDNNGNTVWTKLYDTFGNSYLTCEYTEGDTLYLGGTVNYGAGILKVDLNSGDGFSGEIIAKTDSYSALRHMEATLDGNLIQSDRAYPGDNPYGQWTRKVKKNGAVIWSKVYSIPQHTLSGRAVPCSDGGYIIAPQYATFLTAQDRAALIKLDDDGNVVWTYQYGGHIFESLSSVQQTQDGGFIAVGYSRQPDVSNNTDILLVKTLPDGTIDGCCIKPFPVTTTDYFPDHEDFQLINRSYIPTADSPIYTSDQHFLNQDFCGYVAPVKQVDLQLCEGDSIQINGTTFSSDTSFTHTVSGPGYCDSIMKYKITLSPAVHKTVLVEFCPGASIVVNGITFTQPGTTKSRIPAASGCDTLVTYLVDYYQFPRPSTLGIKCPASMVIDGAPGATSAVVQYGLPETTSDCVCPGIAPSLNTGLPNGAAFPIGVTQLCYTAADKCGSTGSCCFSVTVHKTELPAASCDVKSIDCIRFELQGISVDAAGNHHYRIGVANNCAGKLNYVAVETPAGITAINPANTTIFTSEGNRKYEVRNPNYTPFYSVRFKLSDGDFSGGASDVFEYTLPVQVGNPSYIHVLVRLANTSSYEAYLNTFNCPVEHTGNAAAQRTQVSIANANPLLLYPNPVAKNLHVDVSNWGHEPTRWRILDLQGRLLEDEPVRGSEGLLDINLPEQCANGMYYLVLFASDGEYAVEKFVVQQ